MSGTKQDPDSPASPADWPAAPLIAARIRRLVDQRRPDDAAPLVDAACTTYAEIGATGWLARLNAWEASRPPVRTP